MQNFDIIKSVGISQSFRSQSIKSKYDIQGDKVIERFQGELNLDRDWQIGVIYGASGTGKTSIAKELFSESYIHGFDYKEKSFLDDFDKDLSVDDIAKTLFSVGFGSVPSWLKPYSVLSQGEQMRCNLARAILLKQDLVVFDEYTSVVNREVAKIGSYALSKAIRRTTKKIILVSCHDDILEWLEPDWIFDTNQMKFEYVRGRLQRPKIEFKIYERPGLWEIFRKYHYLSSSLNKSARQYIGFIKNVLSVRQWIRQ